MGLWMMVLFAADAAESEKLEVGSRSNPQSPGFRPGDGDAVWCYSRVLVDPKGRPTEIDVKGCNERFDEATRRTMAKWRWNKPAAPTHTVVATSFFEGTTSRKATPCASTVTVAGDGTVTEGAGDCVMWLPAKISAPESRQTCQVTFVSAGKPEIAGDRIDGSAVATRTASTIGPGTAR